MCRAGSDIGYCDSDYRENHTIDPQPTVKEIIKSLKNYHFEYIDVQAGDQNIDLSFEYKGVWYAHYDLPYDLYDEFEFIDYIKEANQKETACCGASFDEDIRRCNHCKENL